MHFIRVVIKGPCVRCISSSKVSLMKTSTSMQSAKDEQRWGGQKLDNIQTLNRQEYRQMQMVCLQQEKISSNLKHTRVVTIMHRINVASKKSRASTRVRQCSNKRQGIRGKSNQQQRTHRWHQQIGSGGEVLDFGLTALARYQIRRHECEDFHGPNRDV